MKYNKILVAKDGNHHGLMTTEAKWWVYVFSPQAFIAVEVDRLKRYLEINNKIELKEFVPHSSNPTKGYLLYPEDVNKLMSSELYDMVPNKK